MRHPDLHQSPDRISMTAGRRAAATIELGQHADGRWMWALSWREGFSGRAYCLAEKWGNFAPTRRAALDAAVAEGLHETRRAYSDCHTVRAWLTSLNPQQPDLFDARERGGRAGRDLCPALRAAADAPNPGGQGMPQQPSQEVNP